MFIEALLTTLKRWKQPKCPSSNEWINKNGGHRYKSVLFSFKKGILSHGWTLEDIMLSEIKPWQKDTYWMIPHICKVPRVVRFRQKVEWRLPGAGGGRNRGLLCNSFTLQMKKLWRSVITITRTYLNVTVCFKIAKMVNFIFRVFYHNKNHQKAKSCTNYSHRKSIDSASYTGLATILNIRIQSLSQ